jgi:hypothetical protein
VPSNTAQSKRRVLLTRVLVAHPREEEASVRRFFNSL